MRRPHRQHTSSAPDASQLEVEEHKYCNRLSYSAAPQQRRPADHRHRHRLDPRNRGFAQAARSEGGRRPPSATLELGGSGGVIRTGSARAPSRTARLLCPALQWRARLLLDFLELQLTTYSLPRISEQQGALLVSLENNYIMIEQVRKLSFPVECCNSASFCTPKVQGK